MLSSKKKNGGIKRWVLLGLSTFFAAQIVFGALLIPQPAKAVLGIGDQSFTVIIGDIPGKIASALSKALKTAADVAFKNVLKTYLNNLAYNTAVKIATGAPGQKPLFVTDPEKLLYQAGDAAAGDFLDSLLIDNTQGTCAQSTADKRSGITPKTCRANSDCPDIWSKDAAGNDVITTGQCITSKFNLCSSMGGTLEDLTTKIKIQGFARAYTEGQQATITSVCPLSSIINNINLSSGQRLAEQQKMFNPEASEIGQYLLTVSKAREEKQKAEKATEFAKLLEGPFNSLRSTISGAIKTPSSIIAAQAQNMVGDSLQPYLTYTGTAVADAVGVFTNTLASKLLDKYIFGKGFNPAASTGSTSLFGNLGSSSPGVAAAKFLFSDLAKTNYTVGGDVDILSGLASCPDKNDPTPDTCVIDNNFRTAIEQQLTVREALDQGLLDGSKIFGYDANGKEPDYVSGYPYRSLVILRAYRIIPVGWELAAKYVKQYAGGNYSLNTLLANYDNPTSPFYKLVDPNWVLKSPSVFCKKEGPGEKIESTQVVRAEDTNYDNKVDTSDVGSAVIQRQNYCADQQTCIAENEDGSCLRYGYCIEEKPTWKFDGTACQSQYSTCQSFQRSDGAAVAYLKNTIDYNNCNAGNAGCQAYLTDYSFATQSWDQAGSQISFNKNAESCQATAEGCHEFARLAGTNVLTNSGFETFSANPNPAWSRDGIKDAPFLPDVFSGWIDHGVASANAPCDVALVATSDAYAGSTAAKLVNYNDLCGPDNSVQTVDFDTGRSTNGREFTVSFFGKTDSSDPNCAEPVPGGYNQLTLSLVSGGVQTGVGTVTLGRDWTRYTGTGFITGAANNTIAVKIARVNGVGASECNLIVDNVQLAEGGLTDYATYEDSVKTYIKKAPSYLGCTGNTATDPTTCNSFALICTNDEVGCQAYTSQTTGETINGVVTNPLACNPNDPASCNQCPAEYVGCQAYRELPITRVPARPERDPVSFVASTGSVCSASAVGCEEYTNLDAVSRGGEGKEYYSLIKQCVNADDANAATYYSWEGSDEFGYQLKNYSLKTSNLAGGAPCTNMDPAGWPVCSDTPATVVDCQAQYGTNPDCTQFYNSSGTIFYRLKSKIVYSSTDCKSYRNSIDGPTVTYHMIPGQGLSCSAANVGCRAYKGNTGDNVRTVYQNDFESGTVQPWTGNATYSNESVQVGGHSMTVANSVAYNDVGTNLSMRGDSSYTISFWAKAAVTDTFVSVGLNAPALSFSGQAQARTGEWNRYELGPLYVPAGTDLSVSDLVIFSNNAFYIDTISLREVSSNIYLIKDSYRECSGYESCDQYTDKNNITQYLKSFSRLCSADKVGCEAFIDTQNSTSPQATSYPINNSGSITVTVPADTVVTLVNDPDKYCGAGDKGCQLLGKPNVDQDNNITSVSNTYLKNDPDTYTDNLCLLEDVGCQEYTTSGGGKSYFRDPGTHVCEYKKVTGQDAAGWYKAGTTTGSPDCQVSTGYCSMTSTDTNIGQPCATDNDCDTGTGATATATINAGVVTGITVTSGGSGYAAAPKVAVIGGGGTGATATATINAGVVTGITVTSGGSGYTAVPTIIVGGICIPDSEGAMTPQPVNNWVGLCPTAASTCTEIRDPENPTTADIQICDPTVPGECKSSFYLKDSLDASSCNGIVNRGEGCRLFYDTSNPVLTYNALSTQDKTTPLTCDPVTPASCTANSLFKVRSDRICGKWLECQTSWKSTNNSGKSEDLCMDLAVCDRMDEQTGQCTHLVTQSHANETYNSQAFAERIKNYSGMVTAGLEWGRRCSNNPDTICTADTDCSNGGTCTDPQIIQGDFPYSTMEEVGLSGATSTGDLIRNGDFGDSDYEINKKVTEKIIGDIVDPQNNTQLLFDAPSDQDLLTESFSSLWNPRHGSTIIVGEEQGDGIIPVEGGGNVNLDENNILIIGPSNVNESGVSYNVRNTLLAGREYSLSFRIRAQDIVNTDGRIKVQLAYNVDNPANGDAAETVVDVADGNIYPITEWQQVILTLTPGSSSAGTTLIQFVTNAAFGDTRFYLDDVSLKSVLEIQQPPTPSTKIVRSCRMYPGADSKSCTYSDENGVIHRGWYGYCIDRDPQNPKYCLNWWPVDLLAGETNIFNSVQAGYAGRTPLYYCAESRGNNPNYNNEVINRSMGNHDDEYENRFDPLPETGPIKISDINQVILSVRIGNPGNDDEDWHCDDTAPVSCPATIGCYEDGSNDPHYRFVFPQDRLSSINASNLYWYVSYSDDSGQYDASCSGVDSVGFQNFWNAAGSCGGSSNKNVIAATLWTNDNGDTLRGFEIRVCDDSGGDFNGDYQLGIYLNETCMELVQVASNVENGAWANRVSQNSAYSVNTLLYRYAQDYAPFGAVVQPTGTPVQWTFAGEVGPLKVENRNTANIARAGSPYSRSTSSSNVSERMCNWDSQNRCLNSGELDRCVKHNDGTVDLNDGYCVGLGDGFCRDNARLYCANDTDCIIGSSNYGTCLKRIPTNGVDPMPIGSTNAVSLLMRLFTYPIDAWHWSDISKTYVIDQSLTDNWMGRFNAMRLCANSNSRSTFDGVNDSDYCAFLPTAANFSIGVGNQGGAPLVRVNRAQLVQLSFNISADPEQLPVREISIAWGDSPQPQSLQGPFANGPITVTHFYDQVGQYHPRVKITDNWGWCSNPGSSTKAQSCNEDDNIPAPSGDNIPDNWLTTDVTIQVIQ